MRKLFLTALLGLFTHVGFANAVDGQLDPTFLTDAEYPGYGFYFNPNGPLINAKDTISAMVERPDHKIWAVGKMSAMGTSRLSVYLVEPDGLADVTFGDLGLRSVIQPCNFSEVADAKLDSAGRLLVVINNCADFLVYRFLPNGDLDASFATGGVLSIAFNSGGSNQDRSQYLIVAPNGDIIIAGSVATATSSILGIARYTQSGQPAPNFGVAGKVLIGFEWPLPDLGGVNGLHQMADGRILVTGEIEQTPGGGQIQQFVVRLIDSGELDPSYGNSSPGISKINQKIPMGVTRSPSSNASLMGGDGSIVQVGSVRANNLLSANDIFLMRWLPDGQLDTSVGVSGTRQYALDFAGPNPVSPLLNYESANTIRRQDNGDYLISAFSKDGDNNNVTAVMRLKSNFNIDPSFGVGGKIQHSVHISTDASRAQSANAMILPRGRILIGGDVSGGPSGTIQVIMGLKHDEIFAHTFEQ